MVLMVVMVIVMLLFVKALGDLGRHRDSLDIVFDLKFSLQRPVKILAVAAFAVLTAEYSCLEALAVLLEAP